MKDWTRVRINVAAHQENTKTGKKEVGEEGKQSTDFKEAAHSLSAVVQRAARRKDICMMRVSRATGTLGMANNYFDLAQTGSGTA